MHPVIETHLGTRDAPASPDPTGYREPDAPASGFPRVTFGDDQRVPHTVAGMATLAILGVLLLRLSGFRFVVGGAAGVIR